MQQDNHVKETTHAVNNIDADCYIYLHPTTTPSNYIEDGSCYFFKKTVLNRNDYIDNNCAVLTGCFGVDIDTPDDYALALKLWSNIWL